MKIKNIFILIIATFFLAACGGTALHLDSVQSDFAAGSFEKLAATPKSNNLDLLVGANAAFQSDDFKTSDALYETFNARNIDPTSTGFLTEIGNFAGGQMSGDYKPYMMDYLFVSYYQIWDALALGKFDDARVIINQAYSRQQKMSTEYKNLIKDKSKESAQNQGLAADTSKWAAYSDIMNPALTYISGLYFLNLGEYENARQYLARAAGMTTTNKYVQSDLIAAQNKTQQTNTAWVFIETGFAPRLRETRIDVPWFSGNNTQIISIATSRVEIYSYAAPEIFGSQMLANVDAMFLTEYSQYQANEALRAMTKAVSNIAVSSAAGNQLGGIGSLLGAAYSVATTRAEIRTWATLPKQIYLIKIKKDKSGLIKLNGGGTINVEYNGNHIIYIRNNNIKVIQI